MGDVPPIPGDEGYAIRVTTTAIQFDRMSIRNEYDVLEDLSQKLRRQIVDGRSRYDRFAPVPS